MPHPVEWQVDRAWLMLSCKSLQLLWLRALRGQYRHLHSTITQLNRCKHLCVRDAPRYPSKRMVSLICYRMIDLFDCIYKSTILEETLARPIARRGGTLPRCCSIKVLEPNKDTRGSKEMLKLRKNQKVMWSAIFLVSYTLEICQQSEYHSSIETRFKGCSCNYRELRRLILIIVESIS